MAFARRSIMSLHDIDEPTKVEIAQACSIQPAEIEDVYATTPLQRATMAGSAKSFESRSGHQYTITLGEHVTPEDFCKALSHVAGCNAILRTRIVGSSQGLLQVVVRESHVTTKYPEGSDWDDVLQNERSHPMGLGCSLFRSALHGKRLVMTLHHAIFDQWSSTAIMTDVWKALEGRALVARAPFKDFVAHCQSINDDEAKSFWAKQYQDPVTVWPYVPPEYAPAATCIMERDVVFRSDQARSISPALLPSYIEAAWVLCSTSYSQAARALYGLVLSGRSSSAIGDLNTTLGPTIVNAPVQAGIPLTVRQLLKERTQARRQLQMHPALQYGLENIGASSDAARSACKFQTLLNIRATEFESAESALGAFSSIEVVPTPYALALECGITPKGIAVRARSDPDIICKQQLERILRQYGHFLEQLTSLPSQDGKIAALTTVNDGDLDEIRQWNSEIPARPIDRTLHDLFAVHVNDRPSALAVDACDGKVTYSELDHMSMSLACELRRRGVRQQSPVLIIFTRSKWSMVAVLAVLRAGGTCVPVEPSHPEERKQALLSSTKAQLILTSTDQQMTSPRGHNAEVLLISLELMSKVEKVADQSLLPACSPTQAAYIMFTSGSTGEPKGVVLEHRSLATSLTAFADCLALQPGYRVLQFSSPAWDVCLAETMGSLSRGCCVCIPSLDERDTNLAGYMRSMRIDATILTPTVIKTISPEQVTGLKTLVTAGEPVHPRGADEWGTTLRFINGFGPTEASVCCLAGVLTPESQYKESLGFPVGCAIWLVHPDGPDALVPVGVVGEIVIEGPGVARGYLNADESRFFEATPSWLPHRQTRYRFYRTGDMAKYNTDGTICFLGRMDTQVKSRGQRFELGEVERVLSDMTAVRHACCFLVGPDLVAVLSAPQARGRRAESLRLVEGREAVDALAIIQETAERRLPSYMMPVCWFIVEDMPRSSSGKLDRRRIEDWLQQQDIAAAKHQRCPEDDAKTSPCSECEQTLQSVWASVLGVPKETVFRETSFLRLGGDSVLAMQVATQCRQQGVRVTVAKLLQSKSLSETASACEPMEGKTDSGLGSPVQNNKSLELDHHSNMLSQIDLGALDLATEEIESVFPCTPVQEGIVVDHIRNGRSRGSMNRVSMRLRCETPLDTTQLVRSWTKLCEAHSIFRTIFASNHDGVIHQIVLKHMEPRVVTMESPADDINNFEPHTAEYAQRPHRLVLGQAANGDVLVRFDVSHALVDPFTIVRMCEQLITGYRDLEAIHPGDNMCAYAEETSRKRQSSIQYWHKLLAGSSPCLLSFSSAQQSLQTSAGCRGRRDVSLQRLDVISSFCRDNGVTIANVFQVAWAVVLKHYTGMQKAIFGCVVDERGRLSGNDASLMGPLLAMIVCKFELGTETWSVRDLLQQGRDQLSTGLEHSALSLGELHERLGLRALPLFNTALSFVRDLPGFPELDGIAVEEFDVEDNSEFAIMVKSGFSADDFGVWLDFRRDEIPEDCASAVAQMLGTVLDRILEDPERPVSELLEVLTQHNHVALQAWTESTPEPLKECVHQKLQSIARDRPNATAIEARDGDLTYAELDRLSDYGCRVLQSMSIRPQTVIPVLMEKSATLIVAYMAVIKAGCAVMPLDASHPLDRLARIVESAGCSFVLCSKQFQCLAKELVPHVLSIERKSWVVLGQQALTGGPTADLDSNATCYVISTSGSTGRPKLVQISHFNVMTAAMAFIPKLGLSAASRTIQATNNVFDVAMGDIFFTLLAGGCLCMPAEGESLVDAVNRASANFAFITPTLAKLMSPNEVPSLRTLALIGEPVTRELAETWAPHVRFFNTYGPAETTIVTSSNEISATTVSEFRNVGRPATCRYWVVSPEDSRFLCAIGQPGELVIEGPAVGQGYLNDPDKTAAAFIEAPTWTRGFQDAEFSHRFYRTGDLASKEIDGSVIIHGRIDTQVKLRGQRVELGDIEYHLRQVAGPSWDVVVEMVTSTQQGEQLTAFIAQQTDHRDQVVSNCNDLLCDASPEFAAELRRGLQAFVPMYMVPGYFIPLKTIPRSSVGKTDRRRLREMAAGLSSHQQRAYNVHSHGSSEDQAEDGRQDLDSAETGLRRLWSEILSCPVTSISKNDDFFALGGNSFGAMKLTAAARRANLGLSLQSIFKCSTLSAMAAETSQGTAPGVDVTGAAASATESLLSAVPESLRDEVESVVPATGMQAMMVTSHTSSTKWPEDEFSLHFSPAVDWKRLMGAIKSVIVDHTVLRTCLIRQEPRVLQVTAKHPVSDQIADWQEKAGVPPPSFHLDKRGETCPSLRLRIHHAFYDNISLKWIFNDLVACYNRQPLSPSPRFDDWSAYVSQTEVKQEAAHFWQQVMPESKGATSVTTADGKIAAAEEEEPRVRRWSVPSAIFEQYAGTQASVFKAACALMLAHASGEQADVVFGEATANRNLDLAGIEQIRGPCVNLIPVRAHIKQNSTMPLLVKELQAQSERALPWHHVDFGAFFNDHGKPRLGCVVVFQDYSHDTLSARMGESDVSLKGQSYIGELAEVWIVAIPRAERLDIEMHCAACVSVAKVQLLELSLDAVLRHGSIHKQ